MTLPPYSMRPIFISVAVYYYTGIIAELQAFEWRISLKGWVEQPACTEALYLRSDNEHWK
jgi:hypothetical protein